MQNKIKDSIVRNHMLACGDRCILAVSGGADSMALLHAMIHLQEDLQVTIRVVHINHGIRGEEADRDETFVKQVCQRCKVWFRSVHVDARDYAEEKKLSMEEAARLLRYRALEEEAGRWEAEDDTDREVRIALAHHREDNAETILMQMARGSGLRGVSGMRPVRGRLIRPMLDVTREEIENYLRKEKENWVEDSTNQKNDCTRNRIRHEILPLFVDEVNTGAVENIVRAGKLIGQADEYLNAQAEAVFAESAVCSAAKIMLPVAALEEQPEIMKSYIIRCMLQHISQTMKDIAAKHIAEILGLEHAETGKHIDLPYCLAAERTYEAIVLFRHGETELLQEEDGSKKFSFRVFPNSGEMICEEKYTKWFDYDKIEAPIEIRHRLPGDTIALKSVGTKSVQAYMTDAKIPKRIRDRIYLVASGQEILWIVGFRIGEKFKIDGDTKRIIEIKYKEGAHDDRED